MHVRIWKGLFGRIFRRNQKCRFHQEETTLYGLIWKDVHVISLSEQKGCFGQLGKVRFSGKIKNSTNTLKEVPRFSSAGSYIYLASLNVADFLLVNGILLRLFMISHHFGSSGFQFSKTCLCKYQALALWEAHSNF